MKKLLPILFICFVLKLSAQQGMYRYFPQINSSGSYCDMKNPVKTKDRGYLLSYRPWSQSHHGPGFVSNYIIKTDSNFVPQWKKPYYSSSISLPTGGVILLYDNTIEKVTVSGVQIWIKHLINNPYVKLNDGVSYSNKIRVVGGKPGSTTAPFIPHIFYPTCQAYTALIDTTTGTLISQSFFNTSVTAWESTPNWLRPGNADFSKIKRDQLGNFFIYSNQNDMLFSGSDMCLAKFDSSFNFVWGKTWSTSQNIFLNDIDILPNGRIFATGISNFINGVLLKFDSQGNLLSQKTFANRNRISGLCKKSNGSYVVSIAKHNQDSLFMFEIDTSMNVSWNKYFAKGTVTGTSIIKNNFLITPFFNGSDLILLSNDLTGNSCSSYSMTYSMLSSSISLTNFTLTPTTVTAVLGTGTLNLVATQSYIDSCNCSVFIPFNLNNVCVGNTASVVISGIGNLSWYSTATGNSFINAGSQYTYSSSTATTLTVYAQDLACINNPNRTAVNIFVHASPSLTLSTISPTICVGDQVVISAPGANSYNWSNGNTGSLSYFNPTVTTNYTVTGYNYPTCSDTKTMSVVVIPAITLAINSTPSLCVGNTATVILNGANTYSLNNVALNSTSFTLSPLLAGQSVLNISGSNGFCTAASQQTIEIIANPIISISAIGNVCAGQTTTITATGAVSYTWNNGSNSSVISQSPLVNTLYSVTGLNSFGCSDTKTIGITVHQLPTIALSSSSPTLCAGETSTITVSGAQTYSWNSVPGNNQLIVAPLTTTSYSVLATDQNGCSATAFILQEVDLCTGLSAFETGNAFIQVFPNPSNEFISIKLNSVNENNRLEIYNSIGQLILSQKLSENDSMLNVSDWSSGVYYVKISDQTSTYTSKLIKQ